MNTGLRDAAETAAHSIETAAHSIADTISETVTETIPGFAADALDRLESIAPHRSRSDRRPRIAVVAVAVLLVILGVFIARSRRGRRPGDLGPDLDHVGENENSLDSPADDAADDTRSGRVSSASVRGIRSVHQTG